MKLLKSSAFALVCALSLAACGRDTLTGPDDLRNGQFDGYIAGTLQGRLEGEAVSGSTVTGFHDIIVLTDYAEGVEITLLHEDDEFYEGSYAIGDAVFGDQPIVAYVRLLDTGEWFDSLHGTVHVDDVYSGGIRGRASFRAESEDVAGDVMDVNVTFAADYAGHISFNLSPSFSAARTSKAAR